MKNIKIEYSSTFLSTSNIHARLYCVHKKKLKPHVNVLLYILILLKYISNTKDISLLEKNCFRLFSADK